MVLWKLEDLSIEREKGISKNNCDRFYRFLNEIHLEEKYSPERIWNADESRLSAPQTNGSFKVIGVKGSKSVRTTNSNDQQWMTVLVCINATGQSILYLYIFKGRRKQENYISKCEPNAKKAIQEKRWINEEIFCKWLDHFKDSVPSGVSLER